MLTGLQASASGLISNSRKLDVLGSNVANASTAGYKADELVTTSFNAKMMQRLEYDKNLQTGIGNATGGIRADVVMTSFTQGTLEETNRSLDMAIEGKGFFTIQRPDGSTGLTRNGQFSIDQNGFLAGSTGRVLGQNGPIQLNGRADFAIDNRGGIYVDGNLVDTLRIAVPNNVSTMVKQADGTFRDPNPGNAGAFTGKITQGSLEGSNINMSDEMSAMIANARAFQSCSQVVKMMDSILQKSVNEVGRL